jgi:regulator of RNase E activity RraA
MNLLEKLNKFSTAELADAMNGDNVMDVGIRPIHNQMKMAGPAFTIQLPFENGKKTMDAVTSAPKGCVIVISTSDTKKRAVWGDVRSTMALHRQISGVVVDGPIRDVNRIAEMGLPVFYKYISPASYHDNELGEVEVPVFCGDLLVRPGDFVIGDENGVVVVPKERLEEVICAAERKWHADLEIKKKYTCEG